MQTNLESRSPLTDCVTLLCPSRGKMGIVTLTMWAFESDWKDGAKRKKLAQEMMVQGWGLAFDSQQLQI